MLNMHPYPHADSDDVPYPRPKRLPTVYHDVPSRHESYYATYPYANGISNPNPRYAHAHQRFLDDDEEQDLHEAYIGHSENGDDEDDSFHEPHPNQATTTPIPTSHWGDLKLHTASPFSKSTLPPPSYQNLPLPIPARVFPRPGTPPLLTVKTDVYNHTYNYPLAKQPSPFAKQDYFPPIFVKGLAGSDANGNSEADSVLNVGEGKGKERTIGKGDKGKDIDRERDWEKGSTRTRSGRAGYVEGRALPMREGTRTGRSTIGSEITGLSPIHASQFTTRQMNGTVSPSYSNKSVLFSQTQFQVPPAPAPPPVPAPVSAVTQSQSQSQSQGVTQSDSPLTPTLINAFLKLSDPSTAIITNDTTGSVPTPTSVATAITGKMYTTHSAFPAPTPTSPTSGTGNRVPVPAITVPPRLPPLDLGPPFPGPHPDMPRLRPPKKRESEEQRMWVIDRSEIQSGPEDPEDFPTWDDEEEVVGGSGNSTGDSFPWDRDAALRLSLFPTTVRKRKHRFFSSNSFITSSTPAFWAFWLGFLFPVLWFIGGWHFTRLGEQPPKSTVWEWYFWRVRSGWWRRVFVEWWCFRMRKRGRSVEGFQHLKRRDRQIPIQLQEGPQGRIPRPRTKSHSHPDYKLRSGRVFPALPPRIAEKQSLDDDRIGLNDPKRSLEGISFGYPFISRPPYSSQGSTVSFPTPPASSLWRKVLIWIEKPNRVLDQLVYGVKLREVQGRAESERRMFDPWIQRCRYAFCWIMMVVAIGLCMAFPYLIAVNTRRP